MMRFAYKKEALVKPELLFVINFCWTSLLGQLFKQPYTNYNWKSILLDANN